ncbi:MAG TPA: peptidylprolyl isomerase [Rhizomicrobium sp.]|nr:peptidylprolyl isomerase [Rhizomicrobium sp.]
MRITALALVISFFAGGAIAADVAPAGPKVLIQTSQGDIVLQLDSAHAPVTVANFLRYAREGHFDGTVFYRVVPGFVIQAGSWDAAQQTRAADPPIPLEADNGLHNLRGAVAMARGDTPASATAEFFIDLADNQTLDHQTNDTANSTGYAVFGQVVEGMDTVDKIAALPLGDNGPFKGAAPVTPVTISHVVVLPDAP